MNGYTAIMPIPRNALESMLSGNVARLLPPVEVWAVSQAHSPGSNSNPLYASRTSACPLRYHQIDTVGALCEHRRRFPPALGTEEALATRFRYARIQPKGSFRILHPRRPVWQPAIGSLDQQGRVSTTY